MTSVLSGCVSFTGLDSGSNYADVGDDAIIVMGVSQPYRVHVFRGERFEDKWLRDQIIVKLNVYPQDGYIVARLPARSGKENYGIGGILPDGIGFTSTLFIPCQGRKTLTFDAPAGKVIYVGDINLEKTAAGIRYAGVSNFEAAQAHLKAHFPLIADKLVQGKFENPVLANTPCTTRLTIPVYTTNYGR